MPLNAQISLSILAHETSSEDLSRTLRATPASYAIAVADGTGANQAQVAWSNSGTVDEGDEVTFTFASLADDRGAVAMTALKVLYVKNTGVVPLQVGPNVQWTSLTNTSANILVPAGGVAIFCAPDASGWSTSQASAGLVVANTTQDAGGYEILLIGEGTVS